MSANAQMVEYWNGAVGETWVREQERMDRFLEPFGARVLTALGLRGGERVLDVGCGCGSTTLALARAVGEQGAVTGLDISRPMLQRAAERAAREGLEKRVQWLEADAQTAALGPPSYAALASRFGVMFFADSSAAFANLARAAQPAARLAFACWQTRHANLWLRDPSRAAAAHIDLGPPAEDDAPGPFGLASAERTRRLLSEAGWRDVELIPLDDPLLLGANLEEAVALLSSIGALGVALRRPDLHPDLRGRVLDAVRGAVAHFESADGFRAPSAAWLVRASRGAGPSA